MDSLKLLLAIGILSMVFTLVSLGCVAWANSGSRNLSLAMATLSAAMLLFVIQLAFELRASEDTDFISVELTIDRAVPAIRQWIYTTGGWRIHAETEASDWLKANTPDLFNTDTEKVNNDLAMFSLVSYLASNQYDWQLKKTQFMGSTVGTLTTYHRQSSPDECTTFSQEQLNAILLKAGNVFSGSPLRLIAGSLCLPPKTTLDISSTELVLSNPFVSISFAIEPSGSVGYSNPGAIVTEVPQLPDGRGAQFETRITGFRIKSEWHGIRAYHRKTNLYHNWRNRLVDGAQVWFEGDEAMSNKTNTADAKIRAAD